MRFAGGGHPGAGHRLGNPPAPEAGDHGRRRCRGARGRRGWAEWDGTSFATPIAAAMIARTMSRYRLGAAEDAQAWMLGTAPPAPSEFPNAVRLDELEGAGGVTPK